MMFRSAHDAEGWPAKRLAVLMLIALGLRLGVGLWLPSDRAFLERLPDQVEYLEIGSAVLEGRGFVYVDPRFPTERPVLAQRMPGYPLLVAACGGSVRAIRVVQAVLDTSTVLATFLLARRWLAVWPSLGAGAFVALHPFLIYFTALVLSETLYTALLAWGLLGIARPGRTGRVWWLGIAALCLSVYARPSGAGLTVLLAIASVFLPGRHPFAVHSRWRAPVGMTTVGLLLLTLLPWAMRNRSALGEMVWLTTNDGITLYDGWNFDNVTGGSDQGFVTQMPQLGLMNEVDRNAYLKEKAFDAIRERPGRAVALAVKKAGRTWSPVPLSQQGQPLYVVAGLVHAVPLFGLALAGLLSGAMSRAGKALLLLPAGYLTLVHMASVGSVRYRLPADPALAVLAGAGVATLLGGVAYWRNRRRADDEPGDPDDRGFEVVLERPRPQPGTDA